MFFTHLCPILSKPTRLLCPWNSPGKNTRVDCHALLYPGIKSRSPALQADSLQSEPPKKPKNTGVGNLSLLQGSWPRNRTRVSCIAGGSFISWATRETLDCCGCFYKSYHASGKTKTKQNNNQKKKPPQWQKQTIEIYKVEKWSPLLHP